MRTVALDLGARRVDYCEIADGGVIERGVLAGNKDGDPLARWARQLVRRRGARIAVVALARRLAGVLWAVWRDGTVYDRHDPR
jgi:hypothetical protein